MERKRNGKVIAIIALIVGIIGLSLGFAAFSTSLNITSSANVQIDASVWKVGFSIEDNAITSGTVNGETNLGNNGTLTLTQFVISQGTKAQLSTTNGSKVEYDFYIVNEGDIDAFLNSVTMGQLSCEYQASPTPSPRTTDNGHTSITTGSGTISDSDCRSMFRATLIINNEQNGTYNNGDSQSSGFSNMAKLSRPTGTPKVPTFVPVKLTIEYIDDSVGSVSSVPNGDFVVSLSNTTVVYGSTSN